MEKYLLAGIEDDSTMRILLSILDRKGYHSSVESSSADDIWTLYCDMPIDEKTRGKISKTGICFN